MVNMRLIVVALIFIAACAPEPTTPADTNLAGSWTAPSTDVFTLSKIRMEMIQEPKGIVSGKWFAHGSGGRAGCPSFTPCETSGSLIGRNTVAQVEIALISAGKFEGVLVENDRLRGIFAVEDGYDTITFNRVSSTPATSRSIR